ncbi:MAG TPA: DUF4133 domain-containing protein [Puia sp.]
MPTNNHPCFPAAGRPIELLGLRGHYIIFAAAVFLVDLLLFVIGYCAGLSPAIGIPLALAIGGGGWGTAAGLSKRFGPHGLSKHLAARRLPKGIRLDSRQVFIHLKK